MKPFLSGVLWALGFLSTLTLISGVTYAAANGGYFGELLNKILAKAWDDPTNDGTVKNAYKLGGNDASLYQKLATQGQSCGSSQCVYGFDTNGNILCR